MNLVEILRSRVENLPDGDYILGLKAVLQHIEVASRHLERGQTEADDTAFTDTVYRTNQAFEGSLKEAYRVLTNQDPARETPYNIENFLQQQNVLRSRVLAQLTNYRTNWRNPSTHDYRLDFDEDEALLAIVNVSAFAIVLIDQITERISFDQAKAVANEQPTTPILAQSLLEQVSTLVEQFTVQFNQTHGDRMDIRETEIVGALGGFLAAAAPELNTQLEPILSPNSRVRADVLITSEKERLILEVKRGKKVSVSRMEDAVAQVMGYMQISGITQAIVFFFNSDNKGNIVRSDYPFHLGKLVILSVE